MPFVIFNDDINKQWLLSLSVLHHNKTNIKQLPCLCRLTNYSQKKQTFVKNTGGAEKVQIVC